jgi:hypothetical protein
MPDRTAARLVYPACGRTFDLYPTDLRVLFERDWPHCCELPMTLRRPKESDAAEVKAAR